jgi:hypothetical protein
MKSLLMPIVLALLLAGAGAVLWALGNGQDRIARLRTSAATLDYAPVADRGDEVDNTLANAARVPRYGAAIDSEAKDGRATAAYWLARYDALALERDAGGAPVETDPIVLLLEANAAYRSTRQVTLDRDSALARLDAIVRNYGDVLRSSAGSAVIEDAAYNYEFTARMRAVVEKTRNGTLPAATDPAVAAGPTPSIHGHQGGPPKNVDMNQFKIVVPKRSDERDNNPEGGQGQEKVRKG